ncbi:MAG: ribosome recycling factor [Candidatus Marinimicrobia bacterium]|nr:ribosome recycling factor [Candidatus Neomarinimicrobiota bacterium]|tara:strand:- start:5764 stop:6315 length:552 start_codon:yes stop_codon:yes gene_type:complete
MVDEIFNDAKLRMNKAIEHCMQEVSQVRTGRASANLLDNIKVDYYGVPTPLKNIAHVSAPEAQLLLIQPFDPTSLELIEKAISDSNVGLTPNNDGAVIRLNVPMLTEERRKELMKTVHQYAEDGKVSIRNIRRDINDRLKSQKDNGLSEDNLKRALDNVQELTDANIKKVDSIVIEKEKDILI